MRLALLLLPLVLVAATVSFHPEENVTIDRQRFNTSVSGNSLIMVGEYYTVLLREGKCENKDIYVYCVDSIEYDRVEFWPNEHRVNMTWEKLCTECVRFGQECEKRVECSAYCVNNVCRPADPWCGDGVCDADEACAVDCPVNETIVEENGTAGENLTAQVNQTVEEQAPAPQRQTAPSRSASASNQPPWKGIGVIVGGGVVLILLIFGRKKKEPEIL